MTVELLSETVEESVMLIADPFGPDWSVSNLGITLEYDTVSSNVSTSSSEVKLRVNETSTGLVLSWMKPVACLAVLLGIIVRLNPAMSYTVSASAFRYVLVREVASSAILLTSLRSSTVS